MPLAFSKQLDGGGWIAAWKIEETVTELSAMLPERLTKSLKNIGNEKHRCASLAWRAALNAVLPAGGVVYDAVGAPQLSDDDGFIGVSHTEDYAFVVWSPTRRCAVDAERQDRNTSRTESRFMAQSEQVLLEKRQVSRLINTDDCLAVNASILIWCAKEVLYKISRRRELDFLSDLRIVDINVPKRELEGQICGESSVAMRWFMYDGLVIVYTY